MTISTTTRKTTAAGNGSNTSFNFSFQIRTAADLQVYYTDANGNQTLLATNTYSVVLNPIPAGQLWATGGTVTYPLSGSAIASGTSLTMARTVAYTQLSSLINQGGYYPQTVEQALDVLAMADQQLNESLGRALSIPISASASATLLDPALYAGFAITVNSTGTGFTYAAAAGSIAVPVPIAQGGTGAASALAAIDALLTASAGATAAATLDLDAAPMSGSFVDVAGNTGITAITLAAGHLRITRFTGAPLITHGASLVLPGAVNIQAQAGDFAIWEGYAAGVVRCVGYMRADGTPPIGYITAAQLTGNQNDYNPTGLAIAAVLRLSSDASRNITGLVPAGDSRPKLITNVGANPIVLMKEDTASAAANRFNFPADITIYPNQGMVLWYDPAATRWQRMAGAAKKATVTILPSGSGTYTTPGGTTRIRVRGVGAGGGGAGSGTTPGAAVAGGNTTFGSLTANGGAKGEAGNGVQGVGGTATGGDINSTGGAGDATDSATSRPGGRGGGSAFGGGGAATYFAAIAGNAALATGAGGGGAGAGGTGGAGGGGGAGGYFEKMITSPAATYSYAVGAAGAGGSGGTGGGAGGTGSGGVIIVEEFYD